MSTLPDLPVELLLDNVLPALPVKDLLSLAATNSEFAKLSDDDTFWKRKCKEDFNFTGAGTARTSGWKFIYKGLSNPKVYVWGQGDRGRLGLSQFPPMMASGVPYPTRLNVPGRGIVSLVAGGWSFHALDSQGEVFVWGSLEGEAMALESDGFSISQKEASTPLKLRLPTPVRTLSCGRKHSMAFDSERQIWTFVSWGRPFRLVSPALDKTSPDATPVQAECGWSFSTVLTESGDVFVWWPFGEAIQQEFDARMAQMDEEGDKRAEVTGDGVIPCVTWDLHHNPLRLPQIPNLPDLSHPNSHDGEGEQQQQTKLVKIAAMDNIVIGLTNKGHVLIFESLGSEESLQQGRWKYLPYFSETDKVRSHPTFSRVEGAEEDKHLAPPTDLHITHITAHYKNFAAYSTGDNSVVLRGSIDTTPETSAEIIPELQYRSVISVVLGDYHSAALTANGKLLTWGAFSSGALGLGDPKELPAGAPGGYGTQQHLERARALRRFVGHIPNVAIPTEVRFDHNLKKKRDMFCFAVAAAGWHTGALVIDLEHEDDDADVEDAVEHEHDDTTNQMPGHFAPLPQQPLMPMFPFAQGHAPLGPFRVGFAGRGGTRGGRGRGTDPSEDG